MKNIGMICLFLLVLTSCTSHTQEGKTITNTSIPLSQSGSEDSPKGYSLEERNKIILERLNQEDKEFLIGYQEYKNNLYSSGSDAKKEKELENQLQEKIDTKEKQLQELQKINDTEKIKQIKRELRAFKILSGKNNMSR